MMNELCSDADLEAYLDEDLSVPAMAAIESRLREEPELHRRLAEILRRREQGTHSLAEVWRRHRLSCPDRETLGSLLLGVLDADQQRYVQHHVRTLECRACQANLASISAAESSYATRFGKYAGATTADTTWSAAYTAATVAGNAPTGGLVGAPEGLAQVPTCPLDGTSVYTVAVPASGVCTISCPKKATHATDTGAASSKWDQVLQPAGNDASNGF